MIQYDSTATGNKKFSVPQLEDRVSEVWIQKKQMKSFQVWLMDSEGFFGPGPCQEL